jgi:hypothetical protein
MGKYITKRQDLATAEEIAASEESYSDDFGVGFVRFLNASYTEPVLTSEQKMLNLRKQRDSLLGACDFTQLSDAPIDSAKKAEYAAYRQALRDLPENTLDLDNIAWPVKPV